MRREYRLSEDRRALVAADARLPPIPVAASDVIEQPMKEGDEAGDGRVVVRRQNSALMGVGGAFLALAGAGTIGLVAFIGQQLSSGAVHASNDMGVGLAFGGTIFGCGIGLFGITGAVLYGAGVSGSLELERPGSSASLRITPFPTRGGGGMGFEGRF